MPLSDRVGKLEQERKVSTSVVQTTVLHSFIIPTQAPMVKEVQTMECAWGKTY